MVNRTFDTERMIRFSSHVHDPTVYVTELFQPKQSGPMRAVIKHKALTSVSHLPPSSTSSAMVAHRGRVDGHGAGIGSRIGRLPGEECQLSGVFVLHTPCGQDSPTPRAAAASRTFVQEEPLPKT